MHLVRTRLRNVPILAEEAAHVAAGRAHGKNARSRQKMIKRLFLDGIDLNGGGRSVTETVELAAFVHAYETESRLPIADMAMPRTKIAMRFVVRLGFPPARFVK